ncbi:MAG: uracil-DNA glycosylase family protein, partial [Paenisporosarcina sp.]
MSRFVGGIGPLEPDLMAVGEAPGKHEHEQGIPFCGPSGEILNECFYKAGIRRSQVYVTNVCKYQPPMNDLRKLHMIGVNLEEQAERLWRDEIQTLRPKCILAVGDTALEHLTGYTGILNYRGSILLAKDGVTKVVPTIHPAALFPHWEGGQQRGGLEYTYLKLIEHDIARAVEESKTRQLSLPDRQIDVCHNSLELHRFFERYKQLDKAAVDIESINCIPVCVGFAFSRHHAISIPLLRRIGSNSLTDMGDNELDECWRVIDRELRRLKLVGQNFKYDEFKLGLIGFECPNVYSDTLIKTRVIFPELPDKSLNALSSLWTREPYYKQEGKEFKLGKKK